jgi:hypothetical protein
MIRLIKDGKWFGINPDLRKTQMRESLQIKRLVLLLLFVLCMFIKPQSVFASKDTSFYKAVASFVYNFQKLIKNRNGNLCVYGYDQVAIVIEEKYRDSTIFFKNSKDLDNLGNVNCKLFYISKNYDKTLNQSIETSDKHKVVSISLEDRFIENGGTILVQMGRRNFELMMNHKKIKEYGIQLDPVISNLLID